MGERRTYPRASWDGAAEARIGQSRARCVGIDLSECGMQFTGPWNAQPGQAAWIDFDVDDRRVQARGVVVWSAPEGDGFRWGIRFTALHDSSSNLIAKYVEQRTTTPYEDEEPPTDRWQTGASPPPALSGNTEIISLDALFSDSPNTQILGPEFYAQSRAAFMAAPPPASPASSTALAFPQHPPPSAGPAALPPVSQPYAPAASAAFPGVVFPEPGLPEPAFPGPSFPPPHQATPEPMHQGWPGQNYLDGAVGQPWVPEAPPASGPLLIDLPQSYVGPAPLDPSLAGLAGLAGHPETEAMPDIDAPTGVGYTSPSPAHATTSLTEPSHAPPPAVTPPVQPMPVSPALASPPAPLLDSPTLDGATDSGPELAPVPSAPNRSIGAMPRAELEAILAAAKRAAPAKDEEPVKASEPAKASEPEPKPEPEPTEDATVDVPVEPSPTEQNRSRRELRDLYRAALDDVS